MKKLLLSVIAVIVTVAALGTSTFAWFTLSNRASVGQFNAQVSSGEGIEVSLNQTNWYTDIPTTVIEDFISTTDFNKFTDVTTLDGSTFTKYTSGTVTEEDYIQFTLYFRSESATDIYWTGASLSGTTINWTADADFLNTAGTNVAAGTEDIVIDPSNALRVSIQAGTEFHVYEKGEVNGNTILGTKPSSINGAISYYNAKNADNEITLPSTDVAIASFQEFVNVGANEVDSNRELITLTQSGVTGFYTGSVIVRVWIEGWDQDTFNAVLNGQVFVGLNFKGVPVV
jgi:hypothetical protein